MYLTAALLVNHFNHVHADKALVDYIHARKLKISAYASTGKFNCCPPFAGEQEPGSLGYEELDIQTWTEVINFTHVAAACMHAMMASHSWIISIQTWTEVRQSSCTTSHNEQCHNRSQSSIAVLTGVWL